MQSSLVNCMGMNVDTRCIGNSLQSRDGQMFEAEGYDVMDDTNIMKAIKSVNQSLCLKC